MNMQEAWDEMKRLFPDKRYIALQLKIERVDGLDSLQFYANPDNANYVGAPTLELVMKNVRPYADQASEIAKANSLMEKKGADDDDNRE